MVTQSKSQALIIVDLQNDFCPGGALPAAKGNDVVRVINQIIPHFSFIAASKDWHPAETVHFKKWPVHCVRGTDGARFHSELRSEAVDILAMKGTGNTDDGYSAFEATNVDLEFELKKSDVKAVFVCGLTTEYCVKATAFDALNAGFKVYVVEDAIAPVEKEAGDSERALAEMKAGGIKLVKAADIG